MFLRSSRLASRNASFSFLIALFAIVSLPVIAQADTITFEGLPDSTVLTNQYAATNGVTFTSAFILTSGISLNNIDFPPFSGSNVAGNLDPNTGAGYSTMTLTFANPITFFSGYFTYALTQALTVQGFSSTNTLLASASSLYSQNFTSCSGPACNPSPNELIQVSSLVGMSEIVITGDAGSDPFTLDDATFKPAVASTPEPGTLGLLLLGIAAIGLLTRVSRNRTAPIRPV